MVLPKYSLLLVLLVALLWTSAAAYKILVFNPNVARSHLILGRRLADFLAEDGHDVTSLEPEYTDGKLSAMVKPPKLAKQIVVKGPLMDSSFGISKFMQVQMKPLSLWGIIERIQMMSVMTGGMNDACERLIERKDIMEKLKAEKYDLFIANFFMCGSGVSHAIGAKSHIFISAAPLMSGFAGIIGLSSPTSYVPEISSDFSDRMTYAQRVKNLLHNSFSLFGGRGFIDGCTSVFRKHYGEDFPLMSDIVKESAFILVNTDEFVDFPRPIHHNVLHIGGFGLAKERLAALNSSRLSEEWESELKKGEKGVVFFSMGSNVKTNVLAETFRQNLVRVFGKLKDYHFVVKVDEDDELTKDLAKKHTNIYITTWAPQTQILAHPRMRLFITHGGYNSLIETATSGTPAILIPFFADQYRNTRVAERNGWGVRLDREDVEIGSGEVLLEVLSSALNNNNLAAQAKRTKQLIETKPLSADDLLKKSIRFLEANGGRLPELMPESRNLSFIQFHSLDIIVPGLVLLLIVCYVSLKVSLWFLRLVCSRICSAKSKKKVE